VVATDVGNIREMLGVDTDRPAGVVLDKVNPIDPLELARKIDELIASASLRRTLGRNGVHRVRNLYPASKVVPDLEALLERIAGKFEHAKIKAGQWWTP
jgi:glycosyltransferase involved in cell wall biosynthesis